MSLTTGTGGPSALVKQEELEGWSTEAVRREFGSSRKTAHEDSVAGAAPWQALVPCAQVVSWRCVVEHEQQDAGFALKGEGAKHRWGLADQWRLW